MTSANPDRSVAAMLATRNVAVSHAEKQVHAPMIHHSGARAGDAYARNGFRLAQGQRCGDHDVRAYLIQVSTMRRLFARLSALG